jgi:spermidine synthase
MPQGTGPVQLRLQGIGAGFESLAAAPRFGRLVYTCFFLSGFSALLYELAWLSRIQLMMGHTIYSLATTVTAYLSGLALGGLAASRLRRTGISSLWIYFAAELAIGCYGAAFSPLLNAIERPYHLLLSGSRPSLAELSLLQFVFCGALVVIPTTLMGATLPLLADYLYRRDNELSEKLPFLYGINTLGACLGVLAGGFAILPWLGYIRTILAAAAINISIFLIAATMFGVEELPSWEDARAGFVLALRSGLGGWIPRLRQSDRAPCAVLFASGAASMLVQILWNRLASLGFGPSVYIFPLVTAVILAGIVVGSIFARRVSASTELSRRILAVAPVVAAVTLLGSDWGLSRLPLAAMTLHLRGGDAGPALYFAFAGTVIAIAALPAASALGALFPLATSVLARGRRDGADAVGFGYAVNIAGLIAGSLAGSFVVLPLFGLEGMGWVASALLLATGVAIALLSRGLMALAPVLAAVGAFSWIVIPGFDPELLTSGVYYKRRPIVWRSNLGSVGLGSLREFLRMGGERLLSYHDDPHATISVHNSRFKRADQRWFRIDGKTDGGSAESDIVTMRMIAILPELLKAQVGRALVIGLGTGITAAETLTYPGLSSSTVVELSPAMINVAREHFSKLSGSLWGDPRFSIENRDGREFLRHTRDTFDVIVSEPSNPWVAGVGSLFTREFFDLVSSRLAPEGVASVWFHTYGLNCEAVASVLRAALTSFRSLAVFEASGDIFILASKGERLRFGPISTANNPHEKALFQALEIATDDRAAGYRKFFESSFFMDREDAESFAQGFEANTDDNGILQYSAGTTYWSGRGCAFLENYRASSEKRAGYATEALAALAAGR